jgi:deoxyadenosine/deoxycytidine kinase
MGHLLYVEGIIGSGKSTYSREVGRRLNYRIFKEPIEEAQLERFYREPARYAYNLQMHLLHKRIGIQIIAAAEALYSDTYAGAIVDRSLFGDVVFAEMHAESGNIPPIDMESYRAAQNAMQFLIFPPTTLVFLDVTPETALKRIQERFSTGTRPFECGITLEYLQNLSKHYKDLVRNAREGRYPWSHTVQVIHVQWDPATVTEAEWDAVAAGLKEAQHGS